MGVATNHVIQKYTMDGQLVHTYESYGSDEIKFHCPLLSGIDDEGDILVAGNDNRRIDILKADGSWGNLGIVGLEEFPGCARVVGHKLFAKPALESMQLFKINWL